MNNHETQALLYAEKYGIIEYKVKGSRMIYYVNCYDDIKPYTCKCVVSLKTQKEVRTRMKIVKRSFYNLYC